MLGIIGAMDLETDTLREEMQETVEQKVGYTRFYTGQLRGTPVCLARCGIGKVHAALCAQAMILSFPVDVVLNIGVAGALRSSLAIGGLVIASSAVQHDMDTSPLGDPVGMVSGPNLVHFPCDLQFCALLRQAAQQTALPFEEAAIVTGDRFIADLDQKRSLAERFEAAACDMEGGAIAQCCYEMNVPYAAIRAISDTLTGDGREYAECARLAVQTEEKLLRYLIPLYGKQWKGAFHG